MTRNTFITIPAATEKLSDGLIQILLGYIILNDRAS